VTSKLDRARALIAATVREAAKYGEKASDWNEFRIAREMVGAVYLAVEGLHERLDGLPTAPALRCGCEMGDEDGRPVVTVPCNLHAEYVTHRIKAIGAELTEANARRKEVEARLRVVETGIDGVWKWQGEGDEPSSLSCPVVMSADTARELAMAAEQCEAYRQRTLELEGQRRALDRETIVTLSDDTLRALESMLG